ncbi:ABC transporter permease [Micromonospora polyrhachis]|uniref:Transport permease protein n=1 Tax=Micromonospora polyrhachis TaxID=1282883 RepID=A0A7W7WQ31_9ACTN|nr:ABC transporter permease [Micromonospora polyrhachis]MBB4959404.1 ABC-2 type transport system permease protein [Micromonospora polyrhachis]
MTGLTKMINVETKLYLREPLAAFFGIAFPALLILVLGLAMPGMMDPLEGMGGKRGIDVYLPITLTLAIATVAMVTLLGVLATYRERGVLRRLSTTPVSPMTLLGAQVIVNAGALLVGSGLAWLVAAIVFDVSPPENVVGFVLAFTLGSFAMCSLALLVVAVTPSARASSGIGSLIYYPMMFFAGVWTPGPLMPDLAKKIGDFTPLGATSQALQDAWTGSWPTPLHLVVMVAFTVVLGGLAARYLRWE